MRAVKAMHVHLCQVSSNCVIPYGRCHSVTLSWVTIKSYRQSSLVLSMITVCKTVHAMYLCSTAGISVFGVRMHVMCLSVQE